MKRLYFQGKDIARRHHMAFLDDIRAQFPNVSETGIQEIAKVELARVQPRHDRYVQALFGRDILTEHPESIAAWSYLTPMQKRMVTQTPLAERSSMVDPDGLSQTYVWRKKNGWTQEVNDWDVEIIRNSPARSWFVDRDVHGEVRPARAWDLPVIETTSFRDAAEAKRFEQSLNRKKSWSGV